MSVRVDSPLLWFRFPSEHTAPTMTKERYKFENIALFLPEMFCDDQACQISSQIPHCGLNWTTLVSENSRLRSSLSGGKEIPFLHSPCPLSVHSLPLFHIDTITTDDDDDDDGGGGG